MHEDDARSIRGDRALGLAESDRLGFQAIAARIATSLVDHASDDGLVVGIEGSWGAGKSSLLFLVAAEMDQMHQDRRPTRITFQPWLVGDRDALIRSLFGEFSRELDAIALLAGDSTRVSVAKAREAGDALRGFMNGLGKVGAVLEFAGRASGLGLLELAGQGVKAAGEVTAGESEQPQLSELKDRLIRVLRELDHRFIVTIDDVDRLEPAEALEVLRLVRSVMDLPNVIYLLCYANGILSHSIKEAARVENGRAYLEKIVQLTIMVPEPEPMRLRQWFTDELHSIAAVKDDRERQRLQQVIDFEGSRQFKTPRSVVRALDAIRFFWPPLRQIGADLADLVWLQLIKDGNPDLYRWIERYCATSAVVSVGIARIDEAEKAAELAALMKAVPEDHFASLEYRNHFADQLPGVEANYDANKLPFSIFERQTDRERSESLRGRRLASPDHYRLYFALTDPSHALPINEIRDVWEAFSLGAAEAGTAFLHLYMQSAGGSITLADILLERLKDGEYLRLSPDQIEALLTALAGVLDEAYRRRSFDRFWINSVWDRAERILPLLLERLNLQRREATLTEMFSNGAALGWLTRVFRRETFAHGRFGEKRRPENEWVFTDIELEQINSVMLARFQSMTIDQVLNEIDPANLLYAWSQAGDPEGPRHLIEKEIISDEGFVRVLEKLTSEITSSDRGSYKVLNRDNVDLFTDFDLAKAKLFTLQDHPELGERIAVLVTAVADDRHF
ncbi:KAP family P-loop NTPase fold protein [Glacieibacterium megasporae]|uniref:KAP family P-loop NTPase fold protein n=1 Tax=Glacieibacterium megasporae TaxID=2835787 RepID=UPI001C1E6E5C|nr:P-loop NTPase fold protein [Polymorphobacter megasporae]UAJ09452.1 KAP family NTPase [Polymorphobacter megasporae]